MRLNRSFYQAVLLPTVLWGLLFGGACSKKEDNSARAANPASGRTQEAEYAETEWSGPAWPSLALLETGENPIWFELGKDGPALIESPSAAVLAPYTPWPHARFVTGMTLWQNFLVMAINRYGFLILGAEKTSAETASPDAARAVLYKSADAALWDPYTAESLFMWENKPALLLYRNDFFSEPAAPPLKPQVYVLDESSAVPRGASVPALEQFPQGGFWETEEVHRGHDGFWYYRVKEKGQAQNKTAYFRAENPADKGEEISIAEWRNSGNPEGPEKIPARLSAILEKAAELRQGSIPVAVALSPAFEGQRLFSAAVIDAGAAPGEHTVPLYAYIRETPEPLALAVFSDGSGFYSSGADAAVKPFSLPALPQGFAYSGIALLGNVLAASWEEQEDAGIGAAGFMVKTFN